MSKEREYVEARERADHLYSKRDSAIAESNTAEQLAVLALDALGINAQGRSLCAMYRAGERDANERIQNDAPFITHAVKSRVD